MKKLLIFMLAFGVFFGCADPKVDGTSDETMKDSIAKVRESLPDDKKPEFDEALQILAFSQFDFGELMAAGMTDNTDFLESKMRIAVNGKTADQIMAEANKIKIEREMRQEKQALQEIIELEEIRKTSLEARAELDKFEVMRSRFYKRAGTFGDDPIIELTVHNGTSYPVSRVYFEGVIASPGRSVPWLKKDFNYKIRGGLEPGEEDSWKLSPNSFSEWGTVDVPSDAIFTVTVERLDGPGGEPLFSTEIFDESDEKRLQELKEKYGVE